MIGLRNRAVILAYHSIGRNDSPWTVTPEAFAAQMALLKERGFNVVSLDTIAEYRRTGMIPPRTLAITLDDGYRDNYTTGFPILKQHGFPATIFLTTADLGGVRDLHGIPFEILSEQEIAELAASGLVSFGAHSVTHPKFTKISPEAAEGETRESKAMVERLAGASCRHFAYPHGRYSPEAARAVARAGITYAYTTEPGFVGPVSDNFLLERNVLDSKTTLPEFVRIARYGILSLHRLKRDLLS